MGYLGGRYLIKDAAQGSYRQGKQVSFVSRRWGFRKLSNDKAASKHVETNGKLGSNRCSL